MYDLFLKLCQMSLTAALTALVVLVLRAVLVKGKAPAVLRLLLWAVVFFRMVCPVSFSSVWSPASLLEAAAPEPVEQTEQATESRPVTETAQPMENQPVPALPTGELLPEDATVEFSTVEPTVAVQKSARILEVLWLAGLLGLWGWFMVQQRKLQKAMATAVRVDPGVWESDQPGPPFVLGLMSPRIYLPAGLAEPDRSYVLAHERLHLRRGDFLWKPLFFLAVSLHWFNPVLWISWKLFCRDLEVSCDEGVLRTLPEGEKSGYARALLHLAAPETARIPAAFGEHDVSRRVKGALAYRKPALAAAVVLAVLAVGVGLWLCADPAQGGLPEQPPTITLSTDRNSLELSAAEWDGETPPDPAKLLENAPRLVEDNAWSHGASVTFGGEPYPDKGVFTDYLLQGEDWVAGHSASMTFSLVLQPRADSDGSGEPEERGVVFTYTWKEGFTSRSATYAFRLAVPSVQPDQEWTEPLVYAGGKRLEVFDEDDAADFLDLQMQTEVLGVPMDGIITINDPTEPFARTEARLYRLDNGGLSLGHEVVGGSSGGGGEHNRSSFGFPVNAAERGWPASEPLMVGLEVVYTWADGSTSTFRSVFRALPEGIGVVDTLPEFFRQNGEATLLWQDGALALAAVARPAEAYVCRTDNGGLDWTTLYGLPQPPYHDTTWAALSITEQGEQLVMERRNRETGEIQQLYADRTYALNWVAQKPIADLGAVTPEDVPAYSATEWMDTWGLDPVVRLYPDTMTYGEDTTGVTVCVCNYGVSGRNELGVLVDGVFSWFDHGLGEYGLSGQHAWAQPQWADLDGDGTDELVITHYAAHGTGVSLSNLDILEPVGDGHYTETASFSLYDDGSAALVDGLLAELGLEGVYCGDICSFPDPFTVSLELCDSGSPYLLDYCGTLICTLAYDGHSITLADPHYEPYPSYDDLQESQE